MYKMVALMLLVIAGSEIYCQNFTEFLSEIALLSEADRQAKADSMITVIESFPFTENDTTVHFIYTGSAANIYVAGDQTEWQPNMQMTKISGTNFWYKSAVYESDARLDYKLVLNGSGWILDHRNPFTCNGGYGPNSELRMPRYVPPVEIIYRSDILHGTVSDTTLFSTNLNNSRKVYIYLPPGYETGSDFAFILFHDGPDYLNLAKAQNILDNLIHENQIEPLVALFIPPVNRTPEYASTQQTNFTSFIIEEVIPWMEGRYKITAEVKRRALIGSSNGGNISLWVGGNYPHVFGNVGAQSSNVESNVHDLFINSDKMDLRIFIDLGKYDITELVPRVHNFIPVLQTKGYEYVFKEYPEGHSWGNWKGHLDDILKYFFPTPFTSTEVIEVPTGFQLFQNYPNPFNPKSKIIFQIAESGKVELVVHDLLGRKTAELVNEEKPPGSYTIGFDASYLSSGVYFYTLKMGSNAETKKMVLTK